MMHQTPTRLFALLCLAMITIGCGWKDMEQWNHYAVWSDDSTGIAGVYEFFEGKSSVTHLRKRSIESEIFIMPYEGVPAAPERLMNKGKGRVTQLFYMKSAGYVVVAREDRLEELDEGMNQVSKFYLDKVDLNGNVTSLGAREALTMISCDPAGQSATTTGAVLAGYPSPDGGLIAVVRTDTTCSDQDTEIQFLDSQNLDQIGETVVIEERITTLGITDYAWLENGRFARIAMSFNGPEGASYAPNTAPEDVSGLDYACFYPPTTSSQTDTAQRYVNVSSEGEVSWSANDHELTFGCP